jgi:hypothetical protein
MSGRCWIVWAGLTAMAMASTSTAAEGWSLSKLVPFQKSSASKRAHASVSDAGRSTGFPRMSLPTWGKKSHAAAPKHSAKPSALSKVTKDTKDMLAKTKDALTPGSKTSKKTKTQSNKKSTMKTWFSSWIPHKKKTKPSKTVQDFLSIPRPGI